MAITAKEPEQNYSAAPEGLHQAVCVDVVDKGLVQTKFGPKHRVQIRWQLEEMDPKSGRRHLITASYTNSLHSKARLRQQLTSWRGKDFTKDELRGFDLEKLLGINCQLQIIHQMGEDGSTYAVIQAIVPAAKGTTKLRGQDYTRVKDRTDHDGNGNGSTNAGGVDDDIPF